MDCLSFFSRLLWSAWLFGRIVMHCITVIIAVRIRNQFHKAQTYTIHSILINHHQCRKRGRRRNIKVYVRSMLHHFRACVPHSLVICLFLGAPAQFPQWMSRSFIRRAWMILMYYQSMQLVVLGLVLLSTFGRLVLNMFGPRTVNHPNCSGPNLILQSQECGYLFPPFLEYGYHVGTHTHIYIYMYIYIYTHTNTISLCVCMFVFLFRKIFCCRMPYAMLLHVWSRWRLTFFLRLKSHPAADFESSNYSSVIKARLQCNINSFKCDLPVGCGFLRVVHEWPGRHSFVMWNAQGRARGQRRSKHCGLEIWLVRPSQWFPVEGEFCCYRMLPFALWCWSVESGGFCCCCDWVESCDFPAFTLTKKLSRPLDNFSVARICTYSTKPPLDRSTFRIVWSL